MAGCVNKVTLSLDDVEEKWCNWHSGDSVYYLLCLCWHEKAAGHKASCHSLIERELSSNVIELLVQACKTPKYPVKFVEYIFWICSVPLHNSITVVPLAMTSEVCS